MELGYLSGKHHTKKKKKKGEEHFLGDPMVRLSLPMQECMQVSVPGQGTKIPMCLSDKKKQTIKHETEARL